MGWLGSYQKKRKEEAAYQGIVAGRTKVAGRQAYAEEAVKVARERARAKARQPAPRGFLSTLGGFVGSQLAPKPQAVRSSTRRVRIKSGKGKKAKYRYVTRSVQPRVARVPAMAQPQTFGTADFFKTMGGN